MENLQYSKILRKNWEIVALIIGVTVVLTLLISLLQPFQYSASTKILIIQKQQANLDAYTATKSADMIAQNLVNIIYTSSFYNEVIESNSNIARNFPQDSIERKKAWEKNIKATVTPETGILEIDTFDVDRNYAASLVRSIAYVLVNKGAEYHGGGSDVEIKIVDDVFISKYPVRPNIVLNTGIACLVGLILGSALVILREAKKVKKQVDETLGIEKNNPNADIQSNKALINTEFREKEFGFNPELAEEPVLDVLRSTEIKTMYDHLK